MTVADSREQLVVRPFDMMSTLDRAGIDYLCVDSLPVTAADPGKPYTYPVTVQGDLLERGRAELAGPGEL